MKIRVIKRLFNTTLVFTLLCGVAAADIAINFTAPPGRGDPNAPAPTLSDFQAFSGTQLDSDTTVFNADPALGLAGAPDGNGASFGFFNQATAPIVIGGIGVETFTDGNSFAAGDNAHTDQDPILDGFVFGAANSSIQFSGLAALTNPGDTIVVSAFGIGDNFDQDSDFNTTYAGVTSATQATLFNAPGSARAVESGSMPVVHFSVTADGTTDILDLNIVNSGHVNAVSLAIVPAAAIPEPEPVQEPVRLNNSQPIIDQAMFAAVGAEEEGENINGPSMMRIPDWIPPSERADPSAVYYLYFAHHVGDYIRMAWAADIEGPWTLYQTGSEVTIGDRGVLDNGFMDLDLGLGVVIEENHLASPDVLIDDENQQIIMYFHSGSSTFFNGNEINSQNTWVSTSDNGLEFLDNIRPVRLGPSYFRVFSHGGELYAVDNSGTPRRALDPANPWEPTPDYYSGDTIPRLWETNANNTFQDPISEVLGVPRSELRIRHAGVRVVGDVLEVYYTQRGDELERVQMSTIDLTADFDDWTLTYPGEEVIQAIPGWEGGQFPAERSEVGAAPEDVNQLRDPDVFEDTDGSVYLIYSGRGEDALGLVLLSGPGPVPDVLVGDMNDDGAINFLDIPAFILALQSPEAYFEAFNLDPNVVGDTSGDGAINFADIPGFITLLSQG